MHAFRSVWLLPASQWSIPLRMVGNSARMTSSSPVSDKNTTTLSKLVPEDVPDLKTFMHQQRLRRQKVTASPPSMPSAGIAGQTFYVETYGCQMNEADTQIVESVLHGAGLVPSDDAYAADLVLLNTCAVRENAEIKIWGRLKELRARRSLKGRRHGMVGVLGCMAERLKDELLQHDTLVSFIAGPDAYRDIPRLVQVAASGQQAMNVQLSLEETYADIDPQRGSSDGVSTFISIMRGCNNMCSFCVVPFTRGRERSRTLQSVLDEVRMLSEKGVKEVTLLGQNVNSYWDRQEKEVGNGYVAAAGFENLYKLREGDGARFVDLLDAVSHANPQTRIRFTSPHPKDFPTQLLQLIAERPNLCKFLHMPMQSGSTKVLERMRRGYSQEAYMSLIEEARGVIPDVALSTDVITGFCDETEEEHRDTVMMMEKVAFDQAYMFAYSERSKTHASHTMKDNVPDDVKSRRLQEIIDVFRASLLRTCSKDIGKEHVVLVEGNSKRSTEKNPQLSGRNDFNKTCVFAPIPIPDLDGQMRIPQPGDYVKVKVTKAGTTTLNVDPVYFSRL